MSLSRSSHADFNCEGIVLVLLLLSMLAVEEHTGHNSQTQRHKAVNESRKRRAISRSLLHRTAHTPDKRHGSKLL